MQSKQLTSEQRVEYELFMRNHRSRKFTHRPPLQRGGLFRLHQPRLGGPPTALDEKVHSVILGGQTGQLLTMQRRQRPEILGIDRDSELFSTLRTAASKTDSPRSTCPAAAWAQCPSR